MQDQLQQLLQSLISLLEQADLVAAKALVALGCLCKADHSLLGAVINPQLLQQVRDLRILSELLIRSLCLADESVFACSTVMTCACTNLAPTDLCSLNI